MIDTLNFRISCTEFDRTKMQEIFANKMTPKSQTSYINYHTTTATAKNYKFTLGNTYLTATGSLTKFHYGNNLQQLTFHQIQDQIAILEELLQLSLNNAEIIRVDFGCNVEVNNPVSQYLDLFSSPKGFKSIVYEGETKYFDHNKVKLTMYDKGKELDAKQQLSFADDKNLLRMELTIKKDIASVLGWEDAKIENLHNYHLYMELLKRFYAAFKNMPILTTPRAAQLGFDGLTAFKNSLIVEGVRLLGGVEEIKSAISAASCKRESKHAIRKFIDRLPPGEISNYKLKQEIDTKLLAICRAEAKAAFDWSD
jgi:hypothetical protein